MTTTPTPRDDGGPAFPVQDASKWQAHGMSLRDHFAAAAMQGRFAAGNITTWSYREVAESAYLAADAMLEARSK